MTDGAEATEATGAPGASGDADPPVELAVVEGFYGRPWSWRERRETAAFLAPRGYGLYLYAPKADPYFRKRWREEPPEEVVQGLDGLASACRESGVRFGVGLSPYQIWLGFDGEARAALRRKLELLGELGVTDLAVLFDDMEGDHPELADRQAEVVDFVADRLPDVRLLVCPTYYSDDPVLDRVFGDRPPGYLRRLGERLDPSVGVFWTGEEVVSREISPGHVDRVAEALGRKPWLWDNYPVNDGQRMSRYLHLRGFTGRPAALRDHVAGHAVNPALQPVLSRIPMLTLPESYRRGPDYRYGEAFRRAAREVLGEELGERVREDLLTLQDVGLDSLGEKEAGLRERYEGVDHPGAREIVAWLDGAYRITDEIVRTQ